MVFHTSVDSYEELMSRHAVLVRDIASLILENNRYQYVASEVVIVVVVVVESSSGSSSGQ